MNRISAFLLLLTLPGCDTFWKIEREIPFAQRSAVCVRLAIQSSEGVSNVIRQEQTFYYTITGKRYPNPVIFQFETDLEIGRVELYENKVTTYFFGGGRKAPAEMERHGPAYLDAISASIRSQCQVTSTNGE